MIKKYISSALIGLGIAQMHFHTNPIFADEQDSDSPCCEATIVGGVPLDSCLNSCLINPGYPYPAIIQTSTCWDIYAKGDFLYWSIVANEQVMVAQKMTFDRRTIKNYNQAGHYRPGFRVGIGAAFNSMVLDLTYTSCHHHNRIPIAAGTNELVQLTGVSRLTGPPLGFSNVNIGIDLNIDIGKISLQQPVYLGTKIIMNLNYGIAMTWVGHKYNIRSTALNVAPPPTVVTATGFTFSKHKGWAVGPNLGFEVQAFLPFGFKALADFNLALQYAAVYKGVLQESYPSLIPLIPFVPSLRAYNTTLRSKGHVPHIEGYQAGEIGLGWGGYFFCDMFHLDLSVTYAFIFQGITVFGVAITGHGSDLVNLESYGMHGITVGGRIDF